MKAVSLFKLLVRDQDEALAFYRQKLGFEVVEDANLGDYRWLLIKLPDNADFTINLELARTDEQKAVVGRQAADLPLFGIETDDAIGHYNRLKANGVSFEGEPDEQPYGTGVMMQDLYGNKIYLNQSEHRNQ